MVRRAHACFAAIACATFISPVALADERLITQTGKLDGDIMWVCNPDADWSPRSRADVIEDIRSGAHRYFVPGRVGVGVVTREGEDYIRTDIDRIELNNLDNLPDC